MSQKNACIDSPRSIWEGRRARIRRQGRFVLLRGVGRYIRQHHLALIALFVALSGTAYATSKIGPNDIAKNAVRSKHIKNGQVKLSDTNDKLRLKCPGGTRYYEGACIETAARGGGAAA